MGLSNDLISQFVKITNDEKDNKKETTVYGTIVESNGKTYVQLDGSEQYTPVATTTNMKPGERVTVLIKNHSAIVTGNISSPSARITDVDDVSDKITEFEIAIGDKVDTLELAAVNARIDTLQSDNVTIKGRLDASEGVISELEADNVTINEKMVAHEADISELQATKIDAGIVESTYATIKNLDAVAVEVDELQAAQGEFEQLTTKQLNAANSNIDKLNTEKLSAKDAEVTYANIDFSNIGQAAFEYFFATSGLIKDVTVGDGTVTGHLVGVTISGDLIEGNTIKAEKLVIKGTDGLYYKLNTNGVTTEAEQTNQNSLDGSVIMAKSITATKIDVKDLVAFGATIGGFHITTNSIYSAVKSSVDNTSRGLYMDTDGQFAFGNAVNYLKFYKGADGIYKLDISASNVVLSSSKKNVETAIADVQTTIDNLEVGGRNLLKNSRHVKLSTNNGALYPITSELLSDANREFMRYKRDSIDLSPITMSVYSVIPVLDISEHLTGKEMTFSFAIRCSHETTTTVMGMLVVDGTTHKWISSSQSYPIGTEWKRISVTATIDVDYEQDETNLLRFNPLVITIPEGEIENFYIDVCEWKIEKGNKATDWTPAPEDMATAETLEGVKATAEAADERSSLVESLIAQLSDSISMLVTDGYDTSLMTQTENGWTFSTADIQSAINATSEGLDALTTELGDTNGVVSVLQEAVNDLGVIAEYVKIGTYEGQPCIELGEGDSEFKLRITNTQIMFMEGSGVPAYFTNQSMHIKKAVIEEELQQGGFVWKARSNGNLGLVWKG